MDSSTPSTATHRRTRRLIDNLLASRQITPQGLDWLTAATDPFHDYELSALHGYPDVSTSKSVVQTVILTKSITVTAGTDLHVFFLPITPLITPSTLTKYTINNAGLPTGLPTPSANLVAGYNFVSTPAGTDWKNALSTNLASGLSFPSDYAGGQIRLIATGIEAVNITPVVFQAGSITVYKCPNNIEHSYAGVSTPGTTPPINAYYTPVEFGALPPGTQSEAALFPNSRTWQASEGFYVIPTLNSVDNHFTTPSPGSPGFIDVPTFAQLIANTPRTCYLPTNFFSQNVGLNEFMACSHHLPWDISGAIISNSTANDFSFQFTVKYFIERIPTTTDSNLLVLAHNPSPYDPMAIELYSKVMTMLPVGVSVNENPLGEWFEKVMEALATALPAVGGALSSIFPPAGLIGSGLGAVATQIGKYNQAQRALEAKPRQQTQRKPLPKPPQRKDNRTIRSNPGFVITPSKSAGIKGTKN